MSRIRLVPHPIPSQGRRNPDHLAHNPQPRRARHQQLTLFWSRCQFNRSRTPTCSLQRGRDICSPLSSPIALSRRNYAPRSRSKRCPLAALGPPSHDCPTNHYTSITCPAESIRLLNQQRCRPCSHLVRWAHNPHDERDLQGRVLHAVKDGCGGHVLADSTNLMFPSGEMRLHTSCLFRMSEAQPFLRVSQWYFNCSAAGVWSLALSLRCSRYQTVCEPPPSQR